MQTNFLFAAQMVVLAFRLFLVIQQLHSVTVPGLVIGLSGLLVIVTTIAAWAFGKPDLSWTGLGVALGHLVVLLLQTIPATQFWAVVFWDLFAFQLWLRLLLLHRCTVTGPVFVSVVERGPYRVIRHPMTLTELLLAIACVIQHPTGWNITVGLLLLFVKVAITKWEERFLLGFPEYRDYASRVKWRWIPGLW